MWIQSTTAYFFFFLIGKKEKVRLDRQKKTWLFVKAADFVFCTHVDMSDAAPPAESLFRIRVNWPLEYMPMVNDIVRVSCIQLVAQFMFFMMNGDGMFSVMFVQTLCFLILGVLVYWLIIHKIVRFETTRFPSAKTIIADAAAQAASPPEVVNTEQNNSVDQNIASGVVDGETHDDFDEEDQEEDRGKDARDDAQRSDTS